ncbi:MAG: heme-binding protein [Verrucomicrobia bacterium]|nr:heme-binding protein [Verrucomicrobiota bacterium]
MKTRLGIGVGTGWWRVIFLALMAAVPAGRAALAPADLVTIFTHAADRAAEVSPNAVIAIVDRDARVLLVRRANGSAAVSAGERAIAVSKAGTAVFLSSNGEAFTSRTAGFIIQQNFPPGVLNRPPGPLVGVGFSSLAYSDINYFRELDGSRIPGTRLDGSPGGVPLYQGGELVAGIGVTGDGTEQEDYSITGADLDEAVALAGQKGYEPSPEIQATNVYIDGISLPYVETEAKAAARSSGVTLDPSTLAAPAPITWPTAIFGGVATQVRSPIQGDPLSGMIDGQARLTESEVRSILAKAAARTLYTRGGIRLPRGQPAAVFITVVNNPAQAGVAPTVLGTIRTPDATIFSWDVAIQKARTAVFFSSKARAFSTRTVGFLAQSMYPPGLANEPPGPFNGLQERFSIPLLSGTAGANPNLPNGMTIFPGGIPLYRNGVMIGAIGVSGDGVDQDDLVAASGSEGYLPPDAARADFMSYLGARLPYVKFPRDAELRPNADPVTTLPVGYQALDVEVPSNSLTTLSSLSTSDNGVSDSPNAGGTSALSLPFPVGLAADGSGNLFVADAATDTIRRITPAGVISTLAGTAGQSGSADGAGGAALFNDPSGVCSTSDGTLGVSDSGNATIRRVMPTGAVATLAGSAAVRGSADGNGPAASFSSPIGLAQDPLGSYYVADAMNHTVRRVTSGGVVTTYAGFAGSAGSADGTAAAARFNHPSGVALDASGNVFVTDSYNNTIRKITTAGVVTTLAGLPGVAGSTDGTGSQALFNNPTGLAIDGAGNLYVADTGNSTIRRVTPAGVVATVAGLPGIAGLRNGAGLEAWFSQPKALALDPGGNLYVADTGNAAIRKITTTGTVSTVALTEASANSGSGGTVTVTVDSPNVKVSASGGAMESWFALLMLALLAWRRRHA